MKRYLPYVIAVIIALLWLQAREGRIRAEALSDQRADSLNVVLAGMDSLQVERDRLRMAAEAGVSRLNAALTLSRSRLTRLRTEGEAASAGLVAHLDRDSTASDSLRGLVNITLTILSDQAVACEAVLVSCDSIQTGQRAIILGLDSTVAERGKALARMREMFEVERRRARPGLLGRLRIALPWMAGTALAVLVLGR